MQWNIDSILNEIQYNTVQIQIQIQCNVNRNRIRVWIGIRNRIRIEYNRIERIIFVFGG